MHFHLRHFLLFGLMMLALLCLIFVASTTITLLADGSSWEPLGHILTPSDQFAAGVMINPDG